MLAAEEVALLSDAVVSSSFFVMLVISWKFSNWAFFSSLSFPTTFLPLLLQLGGVYESQSCSVDRKQKKTLYLR